MNRDLAAQFQGRRDQAASSQPVSQAVGAGVSDVPTGPTPDTADLVPFQGHEISAGIADQAQQLLAKHPSLKVVSGHRDAQQNKRENGVDRSWHLKGRAVDLKGPIKDMYEAAATAKLSGAAEALVHNAGNGMVLHVAWAE